MLHWSLGDGDGGYRVDVTVAPQCCVRLGVDAAGSVQHAAATDGSVFSLSCRQLRGMGLPLSRCRLFVGDPHDATGFDGRLLACPPCCHAAAGLWTWMRLCPLTLQLPLMTTSPRCLGIVFVRWCCPYLDVSCSTLLQSTFVCLWVVATSPCSATVLSCGRWSVNVDVSVSV